ncbi:hypothetical protein LMH87_001188 [Akanthomyces muscarius]|uniref:Uncharacterized protein n=1 Tax=Akanthomyces muscarius TaxID=2231603 RepID=A0A9W8QG18_AKAMU|nr:hypothetical protein LMH87_001188 [Akanthomyces muscarius]KAJ4155969.1 hypothetical protein LMH87_001188 [Akanthomyces muscarius]
MKFSTILALTLSGMAAAAEFGDSSSCMLDVASDCGDCKSCRNENGEDMKTCHRMFNDCVRGLADYHGVSLDHCVLGGNLCHPE